MAQLLKTVETYKCDSQIEAEEFIEIQKNEAKDYELRKYLCEKKEKKVKGEIEDEWYIVTLSKIYE